MKSARLLRTLLLLQAKSPRSARELATKLEVCERTVYRDVDALSAGGVPIFATRGAQGGIHLVEGYRRAIAELEEDEINALFVSSPDPLADLGLGSGLERARARLAGALSERQKSVAEKTQARIRVDQRRWGQADAPTETLALLRRAIWEERRVEIAYRDRAGARSSRNVDSLGLVAKSGVWYVVACEGADYRTFRVDRIESATILAERFERPPQFDLDGYWSQSTQTYVGTIATFGVTVRVATAHIDALTHYWKPAFVREDAETSLVRFEFPGREAALFQLVAWADQATLVEPLDVVPDIVATARALLARYAPATP